MPEEGKTPKGLDGGPGDYHLVRQMEVPGSDQHLQIEIGHVLFLDIVGYSKLLIEEQREQLVQLTEIILATLQVAYRPMSAWPSSRPAGTDERRTWRLELPVEAVA